MRRLFLTFVLGGLLICGGFNCGGGGGSNLPDKSSNPPIDSTPPSGRMVIYNDIDFMCIFNDFKIILNIDVTDNQKVAAYLPVFIQQDSDRNPPTLDDPRWVKLGTPISHFVRDVEFTIPQNLKRDVYDDIIVILWVRDEAGNINKEMIMDRIVGTDC